MYFKGGEPKPVLRTVLHPNVGMDPKVIIPNPDKSLSNMSKQRTESIAWKDLSEINSSNSIKNLEEQQRLGWPLLRRTASNFNSNSDISDAQKQSVVHWVMNLPKRLPEMDNPASELSRELMGVLDASNSICSCEVFSYKDLSDATDQFASGRAIISGYFNKDFLSKKFNQNQLRIFNLI
jgi:hypothetical protein